MIHFKQTLLFLSLITFIILIVSSCDPPDQWEPQDDYTVLLGNSTQDSIVFVFERNDSASVLYYRVYNDTTDYSKIKDMDTDTRIPFLYELDNNGNYLHWEIMPPFSQKRVLPGILDVVSIAGVDYQHTKQQSADSIKMKMPHLELGVIKYSDFEKLNHNKVKIRESNLMKHFSFQMIPQTRRRDWMIGYYGKGNAFAYQ